MANNASTPKATGAKPMSNNNFFVVLLIVTLLIVGASVLVSKSLVTNIFHDAKVSKAKGQAKTALETDLANGPQLVTAYKSLAPSSVTILNDALPNTEDFPGFISLLESAGNQAGVIFTSITPDVIASAAPAPVPASGTTTTTAAPAAATAPVAPDPQQVTVTAEASGSYPTFYKLLANLESSARPIRVTGLVMTGTGPELTGTLTLVTYYQDKASLPLATEKIK